MNTPFLFFHQLSGEKIYVALSHIEGFYSENDGTTTLRMTDGALWAVSESLEEVVRIIKQLHRLEIDENLR